MENQFKACGWVFIVYSILKAMYIGLFYVFPTVNSVINGNVDLFFYTLSCIFSVFVLLTFLCGVYLVKGNPNVHKIAMPIAAISLFVIPFGTIVSVLYLLNWNKFIR